MARTDIAAIILAAGGATRFRAAAGADAPATKLVAEYQGKALVRHVAEQACAAGLGRVIVVTGHAAEDVRKALAGLPVQFVHNDAFASGMASSLKAGFAALEPQTRAALILLGDMPLVSADLIAQIADAFSAHDVASAVVPLFDGERGNPVLLSAGLANDIAALAGDAGARHLLRGRADVVELPMSDAAVRLDIDTPDALQQIGKPPGRSSESA